MAEVVQFDQGRGNRRSEPIEQSDALGKHPSNSSCATPFLPAGGEKPSSMVHNTHNYWAQYNFILIIPSAREIYCAYGGVQRAGTEQVRHDVLIIVATRTETVTRMVTFYTQTSDRNGKMITLVTRQRAARII